MRMIAISIAMVAGAIMTLAGAVAEGGVNPRRFSDIDEMGMILAGLSFVLLVIEFFRDSSRARGEAK